MPILRRIHKQGSSYVCTIPFWMLEASGISPGAYVEVSLTARKEIKITLHSQPGTTPVVQP
jgi:antitoxin component of MazEF toxin-antitoxin module